MFGVRRRRSLTRISVASSIRPRRASRFSRPVALGFLAVALAYGVYFQGGILAVTWNISFLVIGAVAVTYWMVTPNASLAPSIEPWLGWTVLIAPLYVVFQFIPLPVFVLRILSPNRARMIDSLSGVMEPPRFASLSIDPAATFSCFLNIVVYVVIFLLVRDLAWRSWRRRSWAAVIPLIGIAGLEACLGFLRSIPGEVFHGTYRNRNHFAGLLEMVLPISVAYAIAHLKPDSSERTARRSDDTLPILGVLKSCAAFAVAALMLTAIVFSLSKMGFVGCLSGFLLMGVLALTTRVQGTKKWLGVAALALLFAAVFFGLPSDPLANAYTEFVSNNPASAEGRIPIWSDTLHLLRAYPVFGSGLGTYGTAFLKYQTALVDLDFGFAHNDYLQLATELGFVGFLIFIGLMSAVLVHAIRTATQGPDRTTRILGLGCAGAIAAISVHSLSDFNMYIPANALILAWIAGIVAGVPCRSAPEVPEHPGAGRPIFWRFAVGFACLVIIYAPASILLRTRFHGDAKAEAVFCEFGVCDTDSVIAAKTQEVFLNALRREPAAPHRWCDLGEAMLTSGRPEQAHYCFSNALDLGGNIPPVLIRAANFYHNVNENERALKQTSRVLEKSLIDDSLIFDWYTTEKIPLAEILSDGLPEGPRAVQAYLWYLVKLNRVADAATVWEWALRHHDADDKFARDYVNFLFNDRKYEGAAQTWAFYLGDRRNGYLQSTWLFNGDFESEPSGLALDWRIENPYDSVKTRLDSAVAHTGSRSLRIDFAGKQNVNYSYTNQTAVVTPGLYHFEAFVRTMDITTDTGVGFHIYDPEMPALLDLQTEHLVGTNAWRRIEETVRVPRGTRLVSVGVTRVPTLRFDDRISGTAWIDGASLRKVE
jgi:O-antigen ligase/tetratricopeptide (TPR) repeat protein